VHYVRLAEVENVAPKRLAFGGIAPRRVTVFVLIAVAIVGIISLASRFVIAARAFEQLIEFASVKPNAAALRAIVDLDSLSICQGEQGGAGWAFHGFGPLNCRKYWTWKRTLRGSEWSAAKHLSQPKPYRPQPGANSDQCRGENSQEQNGFELIEHFNVSIA
jgi:hypothetical protein